MTATTQRTGWATPQEVADYTGFAVQTLARWRCQGVGPRDFKKVGTGRSAAIRYWWPGVEAWMTSENP